MEGGSRVKKNKLSGYYWQFVMTKKERARVFFQRPWVFSSLAQATQCTLRHTHKLRHTYFEIDLDESEVVNKAAYFRHPNQRDWLVASN